MINFVIYDPWQYTEASGGIMMLHRLAHELVEVGYKAIMYSYANNPEWKGGFVKHGQPLHLDNDTVVVYPETTDDNPLGAKNVVRWILNTPGFFKMGYESSYGENDIYFKYGPFPVEHEERVKGNLSIFRDYSKFVDYRQKREGFCHIVRKGVNRNRHGMKSLSIEDYANRGGDAYLIKVFNEKEAFICYDTECFLPVLAALCGCLPVVIPAPGMKSQDYKKTPWVRYGIAYGVGELDHARKTMPLVRQVIQEQTNQSKAELAAFVKHCEELVKKNSLCQ